MTYHIIARGTYATLHRDNSDVPLARFHVIAEAERIVALLNGAEGMRAFCENVATPASEPLNSAVFYKGKDDRRHFMGLLRSAARAALKEDPNA